MNDSQIYYKITNEKEIHNGYHYKNGINILDKPFENQGSCVTGGLYFTTVEHIFDFLDFGCYLRKVSLPFDSNWVMDPSGNKFRADKIFLGDKYDLSKPDTFEMLIKQGANNINNAFLWACSKKHLDVVKYLVSQGADIHINDDMALRHASEDGYVKIVEYLIEQGSNVHAVDDYALRYACQNGNLTIVKCLVQAGANINIFNDISLHFAYKFGHFFVQQYLEKMLKNKQNINTC